MSKLCLTVPHSSENTTQTLQQLITARLYQVNQNKSRVLVYQSSADNNSN